MRWKISGVRPTSVTSGHRRVSFSSIRTRDGAKGDTICPKISICILDRRSTVTDVLEDGNHYLTERTREAVYAVIKLAVYPLT